MISPATLINAPTLASGDEFPMNCWRTSENAYLLGCEYPGEWLWATSWTGLTLLLVEPKVPCK